MTGTPIAELEIDAALVRDLLNAQHPDLQHLPIQPIDVGWDNAMFRLGDRWCVRLPRRQIAVALLQNEQTWLPQLAPQLSLPVPAPYRLGEPTATYPWHWSVLPWLEGVTADQQEPHSNQAERFATFLRSLHTPAPANAPVHQFRGVPLSQRAAAIAPQMQRLETKTTAITPAIKTAWKQALNAPIDSSPCWLHGDLHARNVLVHNGEISGIIDWGDMTSGDRATDLAAIWMLFAEQQARQAAIAKYGNLSDATRHRSIGWAILFGVVLLDTGLIDHPQHARMGKQTLQRVTEDLS